MDAGGLRDTSSLFKCIRSRIVIDDWVERLHSALLGLPDLHILVFASSKPCDLKLLQETHLSGYFIRAGCKLRTQKHRTSIRYWVRSLRLQVRVVYLCRRDSVSRAIYWGVRLVHVTGVTSSSGSHCRISWTIVNAVWKISSLRKANGYKSKVFREASGETRIPA